MCADTQGHEPPLHRPAPHTLRIHGRHPHAGHGDTEQRLHRRERQPMVHRHRHLRPWIQRRHTRRAIPHETPRPESRANDALRHENRYLPQPAQWRHRAPKHQVDLYLSAPRREIQRRAFQQLPPLRHVRREPHARPHREEAEKPPAQVVRLLPGSRTRLRLLPAILQVHPRNKILLRTHEHHRQRPQRPHRRNKTHLHRVGRQRTLQDDRHLLLFRIKQGIKKHNLNFS